MPKQKEKKLTTSKIQLHQQVLAYLCLGGLLIFIVLILVNSIIDSFPLAEKSTPVDSVVVASKNLTVENNGKVSTDLQVPQESGRVLSAQTEGEYQITAVPGQSIQQRYVLQSGKVQPVFIFDTQYPKFIGTTNVIGGTIALDVYGNNHITGNARVDGNGNWEWQASVPIEPGTYIFNVSALASGSREVLAKDSLLLEIVLPKGETPEKVDLNNIPQPDNNGVLFDVRVSVSADGKHIAPGDELPAEVRLLNIGSANKAVDVELQYTIRNEDDEIISQTTETVAVKKKLTLSKSFYTSASLPEGNYKLTVAIPSEDLIATASDGFKIQKIVPNESESKSKHWMNFHHLVKAVMVGFILLALLVIYFEYKKITTLSSKLKHVARLKKV